MKVVGNGGSGGKWWEVHGLQGGGSSQRDSERIGRGSCTGCRVVGVLRETQEFSGVLERGLKIEIKNFAKGVAVKLLKPLAKFSNNERKNLF